MKEEVENTIGSLTSINALAIKEVIIMANKKFKTQILHDHVSWMVEVWREDLDQDPFLYNGSLVDAIIAGLGVATSDPRIQQAYVRACWAPVQDQVYGTWSWHFRFPSKSDLWKELREEWSSYGNELDDIQDELPEHPALL